MEHQTEHKGLLLPYLTKNKHNSDISCTASSLPFGGILYNWPSLDRSGEMQPVQLIGKLARWGAFPSASYLMRVGELMSRPFEVLSVSDVKAAHNIAS